jgi:hypothetical protein
MGRTFDVPRLAPLLIVAVVALWLPACGAGHGGSASSSKTSSDSGEASSPSTLARDVVVPLSTVKKILPEMTQETATGANKAAVGNPTGSRIVTYATNDGSRRVVISVDQYPSSEEASSAYQEATQKSKEVPGATKGQTVSNLGEKAFVGVVTQAKETHVGGGALYGDLIVTATLQGYRGTKENKAKVAEIIRKQAAAAKQAL